MRASPGPGPRSWLERHIIDVGLCTFLAAFGAYLVHVTRGSWFYRDDWGLIQRAGTARGFVEPYNDHLSIEILAVYRGLIEVFGFRYGPFRVVGLVCLLAIPLGYFLTTKRQVGPTVAAILALSMLGLPDDDLYPALLNHWLVLIGAILCAAALTRGRRADVVLAAALTVSLAAAGGGVAVAAACVVHNACTRPAIRRWLATLAPCGLWAMWALTLGQETSRYRTPSAPAGSSAVGFAFDVLSEPFEYLAFEVDPVAVGLAVAFAVLAALQLRGGLRRGANVLAWSSASLVWALGLAYGRTSFFGLDRPDLFDRYRFVALVFVLLAVVPTRPVEWPRRLRLPDGRWVAGATVAALGIAAVWWPAVRNDLATETTDRATEGTLTRGEALVISAGPGILADDARLSPTYFGLDAGEVRALFAQHGDPFSASMADIDQELVDAQLAFVFRAGPRPPGCEDLRGPFDFVPETATGRGLTLWSARASWVVDVRRFGERWVHLSDGQADQALGLVLPQLQSSAPWQIRSAGACISYVAPPR